MKIQAPVIALIVLASSSSIGCNVEDSTSDVADVTAAKATRGTDSVFDLNPKSLTAAKARSTFHSQSAALGGWVVGMRTRPCEAGQPDVCGDWVASETAVFPRQSSGVVLSDFIPITGSGSTSIAFESVMGVAMSPVVKGTMTLLGDGHVAGTSQPVYVSFNAAIGHSATISYWMNGASFVTGIAGTTITAMDASRFVAHVLPVKTDHNPDGSYMERAFVVYARVNANEKSTLRANGADLFVDWCATDATGACLP